MTFRQMFSIFLSTLLLHSLFAFSDELSKHSSSSPDFLIIGAMKAGTTQLKYFLSQHPSIGICQREIHFFDRDFLKGKKWYERQFPQKEGGIKVIGEKTPYYLFHPYVPERVFSSYPKIKLIAILRNPVDRAYSHYQMTKRTNREHLSFEAAIEMEEKRMKEGTRELEERPFEKSHTYQWSSYLARGIYIEQIDRWLSFFPKEQLLVIFSEDLRKNKLEILNKICLFLEIPSFEKEPQEEERLTKTHQPINPKLRAQLTEYFRPYNKALEERLGKQLPWQ